MRYPLSCCLLIFAHSALAQSNDEKQKTIGYLQSLQKADGGFISSLPKKGDEPHSPSSLRATNAAVRALKYFGGNIPNREKVSQFVTDCFDDKTGGYADTPGGKPDLIVTAVGVMAAVELELKRDPLVDKAVLYLTAHAKDFEEIRIAAAGLEAARQFPKPTVDRWLAEVNKLRNDDGSYGMPAGDARQTGSALALIIRIGGHLDDAQRMASLRVLRAGQRADGGFGKKATDGSDLETTYRVMRAFHMLRAQPDVTKLKEFIGKCRNQDGGYGVSPGQASHVSGTYYASIILHWLNESR